MENNDGYRKVQSEGRISLSKKYREENDIEKGDTIDWKIHSRDRSKLIIEPRKDEDEVEE